MPETASFTGPNGLSPMDHILNIAASVRPTVGDGLYAGEIARSKIRLRTQAGVDANGQPFAPYSARYKAIKQKKLGKADPVDLFGYEQHLHMLNAIVVTAGGQTLDNGAGAPASGANSPIENFQVIIPTPEEAMRARTHNEGRGRQPIRHFFDVNAEDIALMEAGILERIMLRIGGGSLAKAG